MSEPGETPDAEAVSSSSKDPTTPDGQQPAAHQGSSALPRVWSVFAAVALGLVLAIGLQIIQALALVGHLFSQGLKPAELGPAITEKMMMPSMFLVTLVLGQLGFGLVTLFCIWKSPVPWRERIAWRHPLPGKSIYVLAPLSIMFPTAVGFSFAIGLAELIPADESLMALFDNFTIPSAAAFVVLIGILPGFFEEILFRGYMQQRLVQRWGVKTAITVTTIVFALIHIMPHTVVAVVPIGLWLCYIAHRAQSIWPTILCHIFINSGVNLWRVVTKFAELNEQIQFIGQVVFVVVGFICFVICLLPSYWNRDHDSLST